MKKAYLAIGIQSRNQRNTEIDTLRTVLTNAGYTLFIFVDVYHFSPEQEKEMMQTAFGEIRNADLLIAEVSEKAIGVGIEIGYAAALAKPVLYLRHEATAHSTTASGAADAAILYRNTKELGWQLSRWLEDLSTRRRT